MLGKSVCFIFLTDKKKSDIRNYFLNILKIPTLTLPTSDVYSATCAAPSADVFVTNEGKTYLYSTFLDEMLYHNNQQRTMLI